MDTFWDLGYGDDTAIWFAQAYGGWFNVIDYHKDSGQTIEEYLIRLQRRGYVYGTDYSPLGRRGRDSAQECLGHWPL